MDLDNEISFLNIALCTGEKSVNDLFIFISKRLYAASRFPPWAA
jgi:hypothetical protein